MSAYPEHDKQAAVLDQAQAAGEFYDWLQTQDIVLAVWGYQYDRLQPAQLSIQNLLANWLGIDLNKIETEKQAMLDTIRARNQAAPQTDEVTR